MRRKKQGEAEKSEKQTILNAVASKIIKNKIHDPLAYSYDVDHFLNFPNYYGLVINISQI